MAHRPRATAADRLQHFDLFVADQVGLEADRGLHGRDHQQLQQVVLEHVAQHAGRVVVAAAAADGHFLGHGDLHVVDVVAVPDRLEDRVGEPQHQHVLHGLLAQVMVDAIDLLFAKHAVHRLVQLAGPWPGRCRRAFR